MYHPLVQVLYPFSDALKPLPATATLKSVEHASSLQQAGYSILSETPSQSNIIAQASDNGEDDSRQTCSARAWTGPARISNDVSIDKEVSNSAFLESVGEYYGEARPSLAAAAPLLRATDYGDEDSTDEDCGDLWISRSSLQA